MNKKTKKTMDKSKIVLARLIEEQEKAKSTTLKKLLGKEIEAHFSLEESLVNCVKMLGSVQDILHHDIRDSRILAQDLGKRTEEIESVNAYDEVHQTLEDMKDFISLLQLQNVVQTKCATISEVCCELFADAVERAPAKWTDLVSKIAVIWAEIALSCNPYVSTIKDIGFGIKDTVQAIEKHTQEVPDYRSTDSELLLMEKHIEIMKMVTAFFKNVTTEVGSAASKTEI